MRILKFCLIFLLISSFSSYAQQFKWVTGGSSADGLSIGTVTANNMCTDANGNVYVVSTIGSSSVVADSFSFTAYGAPNNVLITSYNCSGQMRWAKLIGSTYSSNPIGIVADNLGHIYVAGYYTQLGGNLYIGYDTVIIPWSYLSSGVIQLDTTGHFNWIKFVGDNTISTADALYDFGSTLAVDGTNNVHFFNYMKHGLHIMPGDTSITGVYDLTYNTAGTLLSAVRLDMDSAWMLHGTVIDRVTNKLYVCGEINQGIYGGFATDSFYAAAFDASRNLLWMYFAGHGDDDAISGVTLDPSKHLHFSGASQSSSFVFNGDSVVHTVISCKICYSRSKPF